MNHGRITGAVGLALLSSMSFALDFQTDGATIKNLLPDLQTATGLKLMANPLIENEPLIIRAKNVDPLDLLTQIANATGLTWIKQGEGYLLARTPEGDQLAKSSYMNFTAESWNAAKLTIDTDQFIGQIAVMIPADIIKDLRVGGRIVLADKNNGNQIPMPAAMRTTAQQLLQAQLQNQLDDINARVAQIADQRAKEAIQNMVTALKQPKLKNIVVITRPSLQIINVQFNSLSQSGNVEPRGFLAVSLNPTNLPTKPNISNWKNPPEPLKEKLEAFAGTMGMVTKYRSELANLISAPQTLDPVAYAIGPTLTQAVPESLNLVASLPDESLTGIARNLARDGASSLAKPDSLLNLEFNGAWAVIKPRVQFHAWMTRRNRTAVGAISRAILETKFLTLATQSQYAANSSTWFNPVSWESDLLVAVSGQSARSELSKLYGFGLEGLQVYNALKASGGIKPVGQFPVNALSPQSLFEMSFYSTASPQVVRDQTTSRSGSRSSEVNGVPIVREAPVLIEETRRVAPSERTEFLKQNYGPGGAITSTNTGRAVVVARAADGSAQATLADNDLIMHRASQLSSSIRPSNSLLMSSNAQYGSTAVESFTFSIKLPGNIVLTRSVSGTIPPARYGDYNSLPESVRQSVEQQATALVSRASQGGRRPPERRTNGNPPPPQAK